MKKIVLTAIGLSILLMLLLASCAASAHGAEASGKPWPTRAPGATPYIRVMPAEAALPPEGGDDVSGGSWDEIYERFGSFYAKKDELEYFRSLPEDTAFPFVPHSARFVLDEGEALRMARLFRAQERVEARVVAMHQITDGLDD